MYPYAVLSLGDLHVYMYGIMIAIGILACFFVLFEFGKRMGISASYIDFAFYTGIVSIVVGFIGSAVWQGLFNYIDDVKNGVANPTFSLEGGITAIGGLSSGALCYIVICLCFRKKFPFSLTKTVLVAPLCMIIAHGFGRLGCLMAGCCHGEFLGTEYVFGGIKMQGEEGWGYYVPVQLYEALFLFLLFTVLTLLMFKKNFKYTLPVYLLGYGIWRFFIEFARADDARGSFIGNLSPSQALSIALVILSVPAYFILRHFITKMKEHEKTNAPVLAVAEGEAIEEVVEQAVVESQENRTENTTEDQE